MRDQIAIGPDRFTARHVRVAAHSVDNKQGNGFAYLGLRLPPQRSLGLQSVLSGLELCAPLEQLKPKPVGAVLAHEVEMCIAQ